MSEIDAFPTIETARLQLREIVLSDASAIFDMHGDADLMTWFGSDPLHDIEAAAVLIDRFAKWRKLPNPGVRWGIEIKGEPGLIGTCGLFSWNRGWRKCIIGYELHRKVHGRGYMHEALQAAIRWGFEAMQLNRIEGQLSPENVASINVLERLGFIKEGHFLKHGFWAGKYHDAYQYGLLKDSWQNSTS